MRKMINKKQSFSIRKYTFGAGSVLIGLSLSFTIHTSKVEAAETITNVQTDIGHTASNDPQNTEAIDTEKTSQIAETPTKSSETVKQDSEASTDIQDDKAPTVSQDDKTTAEAQVEEATTATQEENKNNTGEVTQNKENAISTDNKEQQKNEALQADDSNQSSVNKDTSDKENIAAQTNDSVQKNEVNDTNDNKTIQQQSDTTNSSNDKNNNIAQDNTNSIQVDQQNNKETNNTSDSTETINQSNINKDETTSSSTTNEIVNAAKPNSQTNNVINQTEATHATTTSTVTDANAVIVQNVGMPIDASSSEQSPNAPESVQLINTTPVTPPRTFRTLAVSRLAVAPTVSQSIGKDVNSLITSSNVKFSDGTWVKGTANSINFDLTIPDTVHQNDYFTVKLPKELLLTTVDRENGILLGTDSSNVYAKGTYDSTNHAINFKFTDNVDKYTNKTVSVKLMQLINFRNTPKTGNYTLNIQIGNQTYSATKAIQYNVDSRNSQNNAYFDTLISGVVGTQSPYTTIYTVNPSKKTLTNSSVVLSPFVTSKSDTVVSQFNPSVSTFKILKVTDTTTLSESGTDLGVKYEDVTSNYTINYNADGTVTIKLGNTTDAFLIVADSKTSKPFVQGTTVEGRITIMNSTTATYGYSAQYSKAAPSTTNSSGIVVTDTTPPVVSPINSQTKEVNTPIDPIVIQATDNSGSTVKNSVYDLPPGTSYNSNNNTISGVPTQTGDYTVTIVSTDASYNETTTKVNIGVTDTIAPTVVPIGNQTKEVNTPIDTITIQATDNSGLPVTNTVNGLPDGVIFNPTTNTISGSPSKVGTYPVTVTTKDGQNNETTTTFNITVTDNIAPKVVAIGNQTKEVNTPIDTITIQATDNSGLPVTNTVSGLPNGVTFNSATNTISGSPSKVGTYPVTVTTKDGQNNITVTTFNITVTDNIAPKVVAIGNQTKEVNTSIDPITIQATDNSGLPVTNTVSGLPNGVSFNSATNTISGSPSKVGTYPVTVTTKDGQNNETTTTFNITVTDKTAPTVTMIGNQTKEVNTPIDSITIQATDNSGLPVTNAVSGLPDGVTFNSATNTISGTPSKEGIYSVTVTTKDEQNNTTVTTFNITVIDKTAPIVTTIGNQTKEVNTPIDPITIQATDNSGLPVTNTVSGLPEDITFNPITSTISGSPDQVGVYPITVITTDVAGNATTTTFNITVTDTIAPKVTTIGNQTKEVNTPIDPIVIQATDNSGLPVTNTVDGLPDGVVFDANSNTISGSPSKVGIYPITVTTKDGQNNETTTTFNITVTDTKAPTVVPIANQTKEVNTPIDSITIQATDNSGLPVTNTVSGLPNGVTFDSVTNTISGSPSKVGTYPITVTTKDSTGNTTTTTFNITVTDTTVPEVTHISDQEQEVNTEIEPIVIQATDNSGLPVTNTVSGLPNGVTFNPDNNTISGTPTQVGTYPVTVITKDAVGNTTTTTFNITTIDTTAPTVDSIGNQTTEVNTPINSITIVGQDNSNLPVVSTVSGLPEGVTFDPTTNTISGTPTQVGTYPVTVSTKDETGNTATTTTFVIIVRDTTIPTVDSIENQTAEVNTPINTITIEAQDNSGLPVTNTVNGLPNGVTFNPDNNTISGTPSGVGTYPVTVTTTDVAGNTTVTTFTITVTDKTAPTVAKIDNQTKEVNTPIDSITIDGSDNSELPVTNTVSGLPSGVTFDSATNTISGAPNKVGTYPITVVTTDGEYNATITTFNITVTDSTAPTVVKIGDQTKEVNTPIDPITIDGSDNSGLPVTNTVSGLPEEVTFDPTTNIISGAPEQVGTYPITVTTKDAAGNTTVTTFTIIVTDKTAPEVRQISDQEKEVNTEIEPIIIHAIDNSGLPVTNTVSGLPEGVTFDPETNTISGTPSKVGTYSVTVTTTDQTGNQADTTFKITVKDTTAPIVEPIGNQIKEVNTPIDPITIDGSDNSGLPVTNTVSGLPEGVTFDPETNIISGTPSKVGTYPVTVVTTDANGNQTETTFAITVTDTTAPTVAKIDNQTKEVNTPINPITIDGSDNSGLPVTNTVSGLPDGVTFDPATNTISGTPSEVGIYPVTVTTTDKAGNTTITTFAITVTDETAPIVDTIGSQTKEVNTPINPITIDGSDNSGLPVTNTVSGLPDGVTFDTTTNTISGSPSEVGEYPITVTTTDKAGNTTTTTFNITATDTTAPTVATIGNQTQEVNIPIDEVAIQAIDNSGLPVTNTVGGLPEGVTFDPETNVISGTPSQVGTYPITVTTKDATGNTTTTTFTITVTDTIVPTVVPISSQTKEVNTPITPITIQGSDNSGLPVTSTVSDLPEGVTFNSETNTISGTPSEVGVYLVTVTTKDATGNTTLTRFNITVTDTTAPTVAAIDNQTKEVNTSIDTITIKGQDNSGKPVTNEVSGLPKGVTFNPDTNTISGSPSEVGEYPVTVTTTDANGNTTTTTFTITVTDKTAPTVETIDDQTKEVNTPIDTITINGQDNSGKPVTNEVSGLPKGVTFDSATNTISGSPSEVGEYPVTVTTTDANGNTTTTTFTITVTDKTAPTVAPIDDQTKEVNTPIDSITINGEDNSGKPVTNEVTGLPEGVTFNPSTNTISGTPSEVGEYPVTVTTTDANGNTTTTTFTITVTDKTAPTVAAIDNQTKEVNTPIDSITINGEDNSGKPVTNEVSGLPEGVTFDSSTNTISGSPSEVGEYPVTVTTTDANGNTTTTTFTITVTDKTAPTVVAIPSQTKEVNTPIDTITIKGQDNSGKPVTNEVTGLPEGVTFNPSTNTISGTPSEVGEYPMTVTTTDANGNTTTTTFTITVTDKTAPTVAAIDNQTKEVNTSIDTITIKGEDNSGKPVTNTVSGLPQGVTFDSSTNTISGKPSEVGEYPITVTTTDTNGNTTTTTFTITVTDKTAPTVAPIDDQTKEVNTPIDTITINGQDNSGKPVKNEVSGLPNGVTFDPDTNTISGSPSEVGTYPITVTTTDANGNTTTTTFTITVPPKDAGEPSTPSEPVEPITPSEPGQPIIPSEPSEPNTPSEPGEPIKPNEPVELITPSEPGELSTPSEPGELITLSKPEEPSTPSEPGELITPSEPGEPSIESEPEELITSSNSGETNTPSELVVSEHNVQDTSGIHSTDNSTQDNTAIKDKKENNKHALPETGGDKSSNTTLIGGILAAIVGVFLLGRRRKKQ